ncbi:GreA/GreB family elongation factor [Saccharopolyspora sp. SCSIO 74807]|uniref:GreA/GreB family elongation factor n=1 Tax=Saccharopolyspora sp. SCSIO 74807 TaxID=3118084 RepID=UPI0030CAB2F3
MADTQRAWLTPQAHERLSAELADLLAPGNGDTGTGEDGSIPAQQERKGRIRQIQHLLASAVVGEAPPDDGIAEPGMVLTVRYDDAGDVETFLLGTREAELNDLEVYSPASPLGTALGGARRGEQRSYQVPDGTTVQVTLLDAVPYGRHVEQSIAQ